MIGGRRIRWLLGGVAALALVAVGVVGVLLARQQPEEGLRAVRVTVEELEGRLAACAADEPCPHLVYLVSPSMPLSEEGIDEITPVAEALGVPLSVVPAESVQGVLAGGAGSAKGGAAAPAEGRAAVAAALVEAGATAHYPSVVLFDGVRPAGSAVVGHKRAEGYRTLLEPRVAAVREGAERTVAGPAAAGDVSAETRPSPSGAPGAPEVEVVWRLPVDPTPGAFFRRFPGTRYVVYDQSDRVWLHHLEEGERFRGPGWIDFVPTPDGALFVTPARAPGGLEFYDAGEVLERGRAGEGAEVRPVFVDPEMDDQYPSVGILETEPGERTHYRILISWFEGLAIREYEVLWSTDGPSVRPLTEKIDACPGMAISTPILSKDGTVIAGRDEATGTTKLLDVDGEGRCRELLDLGRSTSKVGFSDDGRLVAFSSAVREGGRATGRSHAYVFDRDDGTVLQIPDSRSRSLVIPEFVGPDSLLFLASADAQRRTVEFRMACCVR